MTEHTVYEPSDVYDNLATYEVGDTVEYFPNNQEGYAKYVVYMDDGEKQLRQIADIDGMMGGKRRRRKHRKTMKKTRSKKRTLHKRETMKHRSKLHRKRKTRRMRK
jgi:hypothetical protein